MLYKLAGVLLLIVSMKSSVIHILDNNMLTTDIRPTNPSLTPLYPLDIVLKDISEQKFPKLKGLLTEFCKVKGWKVEQAMLSLTMNGELFLRACHRAFNLEDQAETLKLALLPCSQQVCFSSYQASNFSPFAAITEKIPQYSRAEDNLFEELTRLFQSNEIALDKNNEFVVAYSRRPDNITERDAAISEQIRTFAASLLQAP